MSLDRKRDRRKELLSDKTNQIKASKSLPENINEINDDKIILYKEFKALEVGLKKWRSVRQQTIKKLLAIADKLDAVNNKTGVAKIVGRAGGVIGGSLVVVGGALMVATAGAAALPVLLAGAGFGIASTVTGGAAEITEKIINSKEMREVVETLRVDAVLTSELEVRIEHLQKRNIGYIVSSNGVSVTNSSIGVAANIFPFGKSSLIHSGVLTTAELLGDDVTKHVSQFLLRVSGKAISGSVNIIFGGVTIFYDVYKLHGDIETLIRKGSEASNTIREISKELESGLVATKNV